MKIESKDFKIKSIFTKRKYIIPDYQRNYSWTKDEEISVFWEDFLYYLNSSNGTNFFIGPMVFKGENINSSEFEVVDGQQRLITFSILISVIVSLFKKYGNNDLSVGLQQFLIYKDEKNNDQLVINTVDPHPFFQNRIFHALEDVRPLSGKLSEKLIEEARSYFQHEIEKILASLSPDLVVEKLENIRQHIFDIDTVVIVSDDETDAFTIFETINTRGKDLSSLDLLKNYIFKNYTSRTGVTEPKDKWKLILANLKVNPDTFFNRFWASWVAKVTENKLYRRFTDHLRDTTKNIEFRDTSELIEELFVASEIYRKITQPSIDDWKINKNFHIYQHIKNINGLFALKIHFPFFFALFEEFYNKRITITQLNEVLLMMENFHFVFTHIVSPRASGLDNKYSKFAIRLRKEADKQVVLDDLKKELYEKLPTENEYLEKFKLLDFTKNKETIKFILLRLEKVKDPSFVVDFELNSLEHLIPKSTAVFGVHSIGNLFLIEENYNNIKNNLMPFDLLKDKGVAAIQYLINETKLKHTKQELENIMAAGIWDASSIDDRTNSLGKITYKLFSTS